MPVTDTKKHSICGIHLEKQEFSLEKNLRSDREILNERRALKVLWEIRISSAQAVYAASFNVQFSPFIWKCSVEGAHLGKCPQRSALSLPPFSPLLLWWKMNADQ